MQRIYQKQKIHRNRNGIHFSLCNWQNKIEYSCSSILTVVETIYTCNLSKHWYNSCGNLIFNEFDLRLTNINHFNLKFMYALQISLFELSKYAKMLGSHYAAWQSLTIDRKFYTDSDLCVIICNVHIGICDTTVIETWSYSALRPISLNKRES